jgi:Coenzyme PQQ synthesis protein D (PqqD)
MNNPKNRNEDIVMLEMESEILIYDLRTNKTFSLNETSALIWQLCDGKKSVAEISRNLSKKLNKPVTEDFVWLALDNFKKENLLEQSEQFEIDFNGLSRRQLVKKIGFASLLTLPVIASVTAPVAGAAASVCYGPLIGTCIRARTEACPASCAPGTPIRLTLYASSNGTCSGGAVGNGTGGCPAGFLGFDAIIN